MSREIKFRAWDKENKILLPIELLDFSDWWVKCKKPKDAPKENEKAFYGERNSFKNEETDRHILMQYTGVKDKNGKEIYEGDILIVVTYSYEEPLIDTTCVVEYDNKYCLYKFTEIGDREIYSYSMIEIGDSFKYELEVIGNIYDNPELLEDIK